MEAIDRFIAEELEEQGRILLARQTAVIEKKFKVRTGRLLNGRSFRVIDDTLVYFHPIYARYLDIGPKFKKTRKPKIHNRFTFGAYRNLSENLLALYSNEMADAVTF